MTYSIFDPKKFLLIAGPCALESEDLCRKVAAVLAKIKAKHRDKIEIVFIPTNNTSMTIKKEIEKNYE